MLKHKLLVISIILSLYGTSQASINSPYSAFGIGEFDNGTQAPFMGMGNARVAIADSSLINMSNPASYSFIGRHQPIFNVDMNVNLGTAYTSDEEKSIRSASMNNVMLGIPISKRWGATIGLNPFSKVGYNILVKDNFLDNDTIQYRYDGNGGANRALLGLSYAPVRSEKHNLSIGVNASYLFGTANRERTIIFPSGQNYLNGKVINSLRFRDFYFDIGMIYQLQINDFNKISLGVDVGPQSKIKTFNDVFSYNFQYSGGSLVNEKIYDTIQFNDDILGSITLPQRINAGFSYEIKPDNTKRAAKDQKRMFYRLLLNGEVEIQEWSKYQESFDSGTTSFDLRNSFRASVGVQFTPNDGSAGKKPTQSYLGFMSYRLGMRYLSTKLNLNDQDINDFGISFGLGLPIGGGNSGASINFGTEFRRRGTVSNGLIQEDYVNFYLGVSLIPGRYEKWFVKRKFD